MQIDAAMAQYNNRPLKVPEPAAAGTARGPARPVDRNSELYRQCLEFESIFVKMMLKEMRATVDRSSDIMSGGFAEEIYSDMLDDQYSMLMSKTARFGLADSLYKQLA